MNQKTKQLLVHRPRLELEGLKSEEGTAALSLLAAKGLTWAEMGAALDINPATLMLYCQENPECMRAVNVGTALVTSRVESKLLQRAEGYSYDEVTTELVYDKETGTEEYKETKRVRKHVAPETAAIKEWLVKRDPERWGSDTSITVNQLNVGLTDKQQAAEAYIKSIIDSNPLEGE